MKHSEALDLTGLYCPQTSLPTLWWPCAWTMCSEAWWQLRLLPRTSPGQGGNRSKHLKAECTECAECTVCTEWPLHCRSACRMNKFGMACMDMQEAASAAWLSPRTVVWLWKQQKPHRRAWDWTLGASTLRVRRRRTTGTCWDHLRT